MQKQRRSVCLQPRLEGRGGPASFHNRLVKGLKERNIEIHYDPFRDDTSSILVIGGTRHLAALWKARRRGVHIVQRLDGINWLHRLRYYGMKHYLRSEMNNLILSFIRRFLAHEIVYQSLFVKNWWEQLFGFVQGNSHVIYNAVDLEVFRPIGEHSRPRDHTRLLVVEGHLGDAQQVALEYSIRLAELLSGSVPQKIELMVVGDVPEALRSKWTRNTKVWINWTGTVPRESIPDIDCSAHLLYSAEINAPCPNSVIEAMACGLPIVGFESGSLPELVQENAGRLIPYGGNPWKLEHPDLNGLIKAMEEILSNQDFFRQAARNWAMKHFNVEMMVNRYQEVLGF